MVFRISFKRAVYRRRTVFRPREERERAGAVKVFLDAGALFTAVLPETGGARLLLKLGEVEAVELWIAPWVLRETGAVLARAQSRK
jgi:hypothetical protein